MTPVQRETTKLSSFSSETSYTAPASRFFSMQHGEVGSEILGNESRAVRNLWPSWRQSLVTPTVLVIGTSKTVMRNFLKQFSDGDTHPSQPDARTMHGMQLLPLITASSSGCLKSATIDMIRNGMRPSAILILADSDVVCSFRELVICDLQLLDTIPEYALNVHWILQGSEGTRSRQNLFRSRHETAVELDDLSSARHLIALPRPHYEFPIRSRTTPPDILRLRENLRRSLFAGYETISLSRLSFAFSDSSVPSQEDGTSELGESFDTAEGSEVLQFVPNPVHVRRSRRTLGARKETANVKRRRKLFGCF